MTKWISHKAYRTGDESAKHTDEDCRHVGENHREVPDDHSIAQRLPLCEYCAGEWEGVGYNGRKCPYCGETFKKLPLHLPCSEQ